VTDFNYGESFDFLAERFYRETGHMAPGKDRPVGWYESDEDRAETQRLWDDFMSARSREAWTLWHQKHGYLR
jgi:hypothetical protein